MKRQPYQRFFFKKKRNGARRARSGPAGGLAGVLLAGVFAWVLSHAVWAGSLDQAYRQAMAQDPDYEAARFALEAIRERLPQARSALLPVVNASANAGKQSGEVSFDGSAYLSRSARTDAWSVQLAQPLWHQESWVALDHAQAQILQAEAMFARARQDLLLRVAQAYFDVVIAQENLQVVQSQLAAIRLQLDAARKSFAVGAAPMTDTYEAQSRYDQVQAQQIEARNAVLIRSAELERITGEPPRDLATLRDDFVLPALLPQELAPWLEAARTQNPAVRAQAAAVQAARHEIARIRAGHLPTLDLTLSYGRNRSSSSFSSVFDPETRARSAQIGIQLNIPLYSGGGIEARAREAVANHGKAGADLESASRQAELAARQAFVAVASADAQAVALQSAVASARQAVDANKVGYRVGTRTNMDVLNAEQQLAAARRDQIRTSYEALLQGLILKGAAGLLDEQDCGHLDELMRATPPAQPKLSFHAGPPGKRQR